MNRRDSKTSYEQERGMSINMDYAALLEPQETWRFLQGTTSDNTTNGTTLSPIGSTSSNFTNGTATTAAGPNDSQVLQVTFSTYGSALLVASILFCWARRRFPKVFNLRSWVPDRRSERAENQYGFVSWIWQLYQIPDEKMLDECGMDAVCFVRVCSMGLKLCSVGMMTAIFLMPIYATAHWTDNVYSDPIVELTTGHVSPGSQRLVATAVAAYLIFGYAMYLIHQEFDWFIAMRHRFLMKPLARNYAVYVRNIPRGYETSH